MKSQSGRVNTQSAIGTLSGGGHDDKYIAIIAQNYTTHKPRGTFVNIPEQECNNCKQIIKTAQVAGDYKRCPICSALIL